MHFEPKHFEKLPPKSVSDQPYGGDAMTKTGASKLRLERQAQAVVASLISDRIPDITKELFAATSAARRSLAESKAAANARALSYAMGNIVPNAIYTQTLLNDGSNDITTADNLNLLSYAVYAYGYAAPYLLEGQLAPPDPGCGVADLAAALRRSDLTSAPTSGYGRVDVTSLRQLADYDELIEASKGGTPYRSSYGSPTSNHGSPTSGYGSPSSSYGSYGSSYGHPTSSYGSPGSTYGSPPIDICDFVSSVSIDRKFAVRRLHIEDVFNGAHASIDCITASAGGSAPASDVANRLDLLAKTTHRKLDAVERLVALIDVECGFAVADGVGYYHNSGNRDNDYAVDGTSV